MADPIDKDATLRGWKPDSVDYKPGLHTVRCDGARGLYVRLAETGAITWIFRFKLHGKARQMGFGPYPAVSLAAARTMAREAYAHVKAGRDPIELEQAKAEAAKADAARQVTFASYAERYMADRRETFKTQKQGNLWEVTIRDYALPVIGKLRMNDITERNIQQMMAPIYNTKRETTRKVVQRVAAIIGAAMDDGHRDRNKLNPARPDAHAHWRKQRDNARKDAAGRRGNHPSVKPSQIAEWFAVLRAKGGMGAKSLEFLALTAVRSGEVRAATWDEIDLASRVWTIPPEKTKMSRDPNRQAHRVPLSDAAVALLESLERRTGTDLVFPAARDGMMSDMTLSKVMRDMQAAEVKAGRVGWVDATSNRPAVPHGLRATFRTWATGNRVTFEVAEAVLAHAVGGTASLAYQRGNYFDQRVPVMQAWSDYLTGKSAAPAQVDPLAAALDVLRAAGLSAADIAARLDRPETDNVVPIRGAA